MLLELTSLESLSKLPIGRHYIVAGDSPAVAGGNSKGEALATEEWVALPILSPISWHSLPPRSGPLDGHCPDIPCSTHIRYQDQVEVRITIDGEPQSPFFQTWDPVRKQLNNLDFQKSQQKKENYMVKLNPAFFTHENFI